MSRTLVGGMISGKKQSSSTYRKYPDEAPAAPTKIHLRIGMGIVHKIYQKEGHAS